MRNTSPMISAVIPTLNAERHIGRTLAALIPAAVDGLVREVIIADGGSTDATLSIADHAGAEIVLGPKGRGSQLKAGAARARFPWLLFLHADTVLEHGWIGEVGELLDEVAAWRREQVAAVFRFALDDRGLAPRIVERGVAMRTRLMKLPYGDQGLLMPRALYDAVGGFYDLPLMEDVDIVRRIGRQRIEVLDSRALTSAERYRSEGYARRVVRNLACLAMYYAGVPPQRLTSFYNRDRRAVGA